jgi:hypothetical protein
MDGDVIVSRMVFERRSLPPIASAASVFTIGSFLHRSSMQTTHYPGSFILRSPFAHLVLPAHFCASPLGHANLNNIDCSHHNYELDMLTSSGYFLNGWQSAFTWQTHLPNWIATEMGGSSWNDRSLG